MVLEKWFKEKCPHCHGNGYVNKNITVELNIPAGINTHQQLRVQEKVIVVQMEVLMVTYMLKFMLDHINTSSVMVETFIFPFQFQQLMPRLVVT